MRSCPVLANITRCPQTRRAPSAPPRTAGPELGKGVRAPRPCLLSGPDGAGRAGPEQRRRPGEAQYRRRAALDFYRGLVGEGRKASTEPGASLHSTGEGPTTGGPGALASRPHLLQTSESGCRGPLFVRETGAPCRCKPLHVRGVQATFLFFKKLASLPSRCNLEGL